MWLYSYSFHILAMTIFYPRIKNMYFLRTCRLYKGSFLSVSEINFLVKYTINLQNLLVHQVMQTFESNLTFFHVSITMTMLWLMVFIGNSRNLLTNWHYRALSRSRYPDWLFLSKKDTSLLLYIQWFGPLSRIDSTCVWIIVWKVIKILFYFK